MKPGCGGGEREELRGSQGGRGREHLRGFPPVLPKDGKGSEEKNI